MSGRRAALAFGAGGLFVYLAGVMLFFGRFPVPWPDEYLLAEPGLRLVAEGRLGSTLYAEALPATAERTYWMPPLYFLVLAAAFAVAGPTLDAMRAVSVAAGAGILLATYLLGRHLGLTRAAALAAVGLLALDAAFLRASLIGRTDALALALVTASCVLVIRTPVLQVRELVAGIVASSAALVQPVGATAILVVLARPLIGLPWAPRAAVTGLALPLVAWAAYIAQDIAGFQGQMAVQLARKLDRGLIPLRAVAVVADQYGSQPWSFVVLSVWILGGIGLALAFRRDRRFGVPLIAFAGGAVAALWLVEMWYVVYLLPFAALGAIVVLRTAAERRRALLIVIAVVAATALTSVDQHVLTARAVAEPGRHAYVSWSAEVGRALPAGSRVLLANPIPDPTWWLARRTDLTLRQVAEGQSIIDHYYRTIRDFDYVIAGTHTDPRIAALIAANADLRAIVRQGDADSSVPRCVVPWTPCRALEVRIYAVRRAPASATAWPNATSEPSANERQVRSRTSSAPSAMRRERSGPSSSSR